VKPTALMMVTTQVRDFEATVRWYRDVLGLHVLWKEPGEFCALGLGASDKPVLALATDHPHRIPSSPGVGWTPPWSSKTLIRLWRSFGRWESFSMPTRRAQTRDTVWSECETPKATRSVSPLLLRTDPAQCPTGTCRLCAHPGSAATRPLFAAQSDPGRVPP
jgi:Glyoxalase/Bleomycin resistance protein/Dioxygenase superfamily